MKIAFVTPYPKDTAASQRFRFEQYYAYLLNHKVKSYPFWSPKAWGILYQPGKRIQKLFYLIWAFVKRWWNVIFVLPSFDLVFIHREVAPIGPPVYEWILCKVFGKKIIYDFDDAIWMENTSKANSIVSKLKFHKKVKKICAWAYKVSCGNDFLAEYALSFNNSVVVNPTTIDTNYHTKKKFNSNKLVLGWTGSHSTLKYLQMLSEPIKRLRIQFDFDFAVIADKRPELDFDFSFIKWNKDTEIEDLHKIDIGVMPLEDNIWEKGKCGFKALQYMAIGVPAVVSPVAVNVKIIDHQKNGFLASSLHEWYENLKLLLTESNLRAEKGENARVFIEKNYSVNSNKENFLNLFS